MCDKFRPVQNLNDRTVYSVTSKNDKFLNHKGNKLNIKPAVMVDKTDSVPIMLIW